MYVSDIAAGNQAPPAYNASTGAVPGANVGTGTASRFANAQLAIRTNTLGQVRYRISDSGADTVTGFVTLGWLDARGRNA